MMNKKISINKLTTFFFLLFPLSIPLHPKISTILIFVLLLLSIINFRKQKNNFNKNILLLPALFLVYISSMVIKSPFDVNIIAKKFSLLVFPLIFILNNFSKKELLRMYKFFILGCLLAITFCYSNALYQSFSFLNDHILFNTYITSNSSMLNGGNYFFGKAFSIFHQSVYFSMYLNIGLIGLLNLKLFSKKQVIALVILFIVVIFQISNKANIAIVLIILLITFLYQIKNNKAKYASISAILLIGICAIMFHPRTKLVIENIAKNGITIDRESETSTGIRILVWDAALDLVQSNFLTGVGVSNAYEELKGVYKQKRYVQPFRNRLNAHNQFFQIIIECGLLGFLIVLFQLKAILKVENQYKLLAISLFILLLCNFFFEVIFNRYSGIMCYAYFYCLFITLNNTKKNTIFLDIK